MRFKLLLFATLTLMTGVAQSADPQPYVVRFAATGNAALNEAVKASSQLESLRTNSPVGPFALVDRADQDVARLEKALGSFGYYRAVVTITINDVGLTEPGLAESIASLPKSEPAKVEVRINPGVLFRIRKVTVEGMVDEAALKAMDLREGAAAVASDVLAARDRLLSGLQEEGHAYARVEEPVAYLDAQEPVLDITIKADPGPVYTFGPARIEGLKRTKLPFVQRQVVVRAGERYRASAVEQTRSNLLGLGIFAVVSVRLPQQSAVQNGELPITFVVVEQTLHTVTLNGAYSSDLGGSAGATWTHLNLLGHAEQLALRANIIGVACTSCNGLGYDTGALLTKRDFLRNDQSLSFGLSAIRQYLLAYNQIAEFATIGLTRKLSSVWTLSVGSTLQQEQVQQQQFQCPPAGLNVGLVDPSLGDFSVAPWCHYTLLGFPISGRYDSTNLADPISGATHGFRISVSVTPTHSFFGSAHPTFVVAQAIASTYYDLAKLHWTEPGRSIIALRGYLAEALGASALGLPPDQRLYAGGSATVRGYIYQTIGPQFPNGNPIGGTSLAAGTIELRQRLVGNWGLAAFVDGGQVTSAPRFGTTPITVVLPKNATTTLNQHEAQCTKHGVQISPPQPNISFGYGVGVRYFTPVGPIRFDVAGPANPQACDAPFEVYIGLGEAF
jgi:translocation and assembly module TamA